MSHSLHRFGTPDDLRNDLVVISRPAMGINHRGAAAKIRRVMELVAETGPTNMGCLAKGQNLVSGMDVTAVLAEVEDNWPVMCVFSDEEKVAHLLQRLQQEDLGLSVVVTGPIEQVIDLARRRGLKPHSAHLSLGIHGDRRRVASPEDLALTSMCGHSLVSSRLVQYLRAEVAAGRLSPREAAMEAARPCLCGIFNVDRAESLFREQAACHGCTCHAFERR